MSILYFIAGASGSGKTAIMPDLKKILGNSVSIYDFDDIGVPENADKKWRQESTEKWLQKLLKKSKDACLLGQMVLGEILACPSAKHLNKINFCLLDVSDFERIQRLKKRNTYGVDQNMLNWAAWLRMHHQDPLWEQHVIMENGWDGLNYTRWKNLENWESLAEVTLLDTTDFSIEQVAEFISKLIQEKNNSGQNILDTPYKIYRSTTDAPYKIHRSSKKEINLIDNHLSDSMDMKILNTPAKPDYEINYVVKDGGNIIGGIKSYVYWKILFIDVLFVDEAHRRNKLGSTLINMVENEAKAMGATLSHLDTFEWQGKEFYLKHGYEIFGVIDDCPQGHKRYYLKKVL